MKVKKVIRPDKLEALAKKLQGEHAGVADMAQVMALSPSFVVQTQKNLKRKSAWLFRPTRLENARDGAGSFEVKHRCWHQPNKAVPLSDLLIVKSPSAGRLG